MTVVHLSQSVTEPAGKRAQKLLGTRRNNAAFPKRGFVDGPDTIIVQFHECFDSTRTVRLYGDIVRYREPKVVLPPVLRKRKCIATDDETLARFCDSRNPEPHVSKVLENIRARADPLPP